MTTIKSGTSLFTAAALLASCAYLVLNDRPAFAEPAAQNADGAFAFSFSYTAAELETREGADAMLNRLQSQVERHCQSSAREPLSERKHTRACVDATMADTVSRIGATPLADVYETRTKG